ncbi:WD40 repeat-like protein [Imleria badia]|nr:WD40 repeat-like protein [Imleria badia]
MLKIRQDEPIVIETGSSEPIWSIIFMPDGKELLSLSDGNGVVARRWRVADGQEVATQSQIPMLDVFSRDGKWAVHRTWKGASVWDMETGQKTVEVVARVRSVDIASDSARFATGTGATDSKVDIWNIITGERLVGPLQHDPEGIHEIKFSPNGEHIATASSTRYKASVHVFDSHSGDQLLKFDDLAFPDTLGTPLAWSSNGQQIFVVSRKDKIKSIDVSTGAQLAEWQVHDPDPYDALHIRYGGNVYSLDLASNGKFLVTFPSRSTSVSFWDTSTLTQIGPTIKDSQKIQSLALSPDCTYLATGGLDGNITIRDLTTILPHSYHGRFHEPTQEDLLKVGV